MKNKLFCVIMALLIYSCSNDDDPDLLSVDLLTKDEPAFFAKTVILFEDNDYLVKTNFATYIDTYPFKVKYGVDEDPRPISGYDEILIQVTQDSNDRDLLLMMDYLFQPNTRINYSPCCQ